MTAVEYATPTTDDALLQVIEPLMQVVADVLLPPDRPEHAPDVSRDAVLATIQSSAMLTARRFQQLILHAYEREAVAHLAQLHVLETRLTWLEQAHTIRESHDHAD